MYQPRGVGDTVVMSAIQRASCSGIMSSVQLKRMYIYPTAFHVLVYVIHCTISIWEGLKSPLPLWLCDVTKSNYIQEASVLPIIWRLNNVERTDFRSSSNIGRCQYLDGWPHWLFEAFVVTRCARVSSSKGSSVLVLSGIWNSAPAVANLALLTGLIVKLL
jgi:hypothetical protein